MMTSEHAGVAAESFPGSASTELATLLAESRHYARELLGAAFPSVQASNLDLIARTSRGLDAGPVEAVLLMLRDRDPLSRLYLLYLLSALHELLESGGAHRGARA